MAKRYPGFTSVELSDEEKLDSHRPPALQSAGISDFPYGLCISLDERTLAKLGLEAPEYDEDDPPVLHLNCIAVVRHVSKEDGEGGSRCRVELQIEHIKLENEMDEAEVDDED